MKPEKNSQFKLKITRAKAKMFEFEIPLLDHIHIYEHPSSLFILTIGLLGDMASLLLEDDPDLKKVEETKKHLIFATQFFDAYRQAKFDEINNEYLYLIGAASYYLVDKPGSSNVLASKLSIANLDLGCYGLENLLVWLLKFDYSNSIQIMNKYHYQIINKISDMVISYYSCETEESVLKNSYLEFRKNIYKDGNSREILFIDLIGAVIIKRISNSSRKLLPLYSGISFDDWKLKINKPHFIKELWPAQRLLGVKGFYNGVSGVIQMPTSAGKTKATELIIRSGFLSNRVNLVVLIAPFRALCHEIKRDFSKAFSEDDISIDELSDVLQIDFNPNKFINNNQILIVTPEKLLYVMRHDQNLARNINLIIFDEGHQFDNNKRGVTYELLITSLKELIPINIQIVLISAVISNADQINDWLTKSEGTVIEGGINLLPTYRNIAFTKWLSNLGDLVFVDPEDIDQEEFFVPKLFQQTLLRKFPREINNRFFPKRNDKNDIAIFLLFRLINQGSVAIFCGLKKSVNTIGARILDIMKRGYQCTQVLESSKIIEINKLVALHNKNFGVDYIATKIAHIGIFSHHNGIPQGIRLCVEYALNNRDIKAVICTSTLAQGVNLPIKYLLIPTTFQAGERILVRDFQNLIGRTGRSGFHTEGTIIFTNNLIFDNKTIEWLYVKRLLDPVFSEPCSSKIFSLFSPLIDENGYYLYFDPSEIAKIYIDFPNEILEKIVEAYTFEGDIILKIKKNLSSIINIFENIESYILAHENEINNEELYLIEIEKLSKKTLAYSIANEDQKESLSELFISLAKNILIKVPDSRKRVVFGKTLFGLNKSLEIEKWVVENEDFISQVRNPEELFNLSWSFITRMISKQSFQNCSKIEAKKEMFFKWINGESYFDIFQFLQTNGIKYKTISRNFSYKLEDIIDICDNYFSYEGSIILGAIIDYYFSIYSNNETLKKIFEISQKQLKYGLQNELSIIFYELGFVDRVLSQEMSILLDDDSENFSKEFLLKKIKSKKYLEKIFILLNEYPSYFSEVYRQITRLKP